MWGTKEHYDVMDAFERFNKHLRLDREKDEVWQKKGYMYQSGETNEAFKYFLAGYSYAKAVFNT